MNLLGPNPQRGYGPVDWSRLSQKRAETSELTPLNLLGSRGAEPKEAEAKTTDVAEAITSSEKAGTSDLLIRGLVERLPESDEVWSLDERAKWLRTAASIFALVYRASEAEEGEIGVVVAKPGSRSSLND
jgi:hypothetical protein